MKRQKVQKDNKKTYENGTKPKKKIKDIQKRVTGTKLKKTEQIQDISNDDTGT